MTLEETKAFVNNPELIIEGEIWREHPVFKGHYGSNLGRMRYYDRKDNLKIRKQHVNVNRLVTKITIKDEHHMIFVGRFILECFGFFADEESCFAGHLNGIVYDNRLVNLKWMSRVDIRNIEENREKRKDVGVKYYKSARPVLEKRGGVVINEFKSLIDASTNIKNRLSLTFVEKTISKKISECLNKRLDSAYGSSWEWKDYKYELEDGEVVKKHPRLDVLVSNKGWIKKPYKEREYGVISNRGGYLIVSINDENYQMHRLVAETFIPNPEDKPCIDHIDANPRNNCVDNLRWCTVKENMGYLFERRRSEQEAEKKKKEAGRRVSVALF